MRSSGLAMRWVGYLFCTIAMLHLSGVHWVTLQAFAWTRMAIEYSKQYGVEDGLGKTFDGQHPCGMCKKIQTAKQQEEKQLPLLKLEKKSEPFFTAKKFTLPPPSFQVLDWPYAVSTFYSFDAFPPVTPPPIAA